MQTLFVRYLLLAVVLCLPLSSRADSFTLGGGLNFSTTDTEEEEGVEQSSRLGFNVGVGFEKEVAPGVFLVPEINLESRGAVAEGYDEDFDTDIKATLKMTYLQVPLFLMLKFPAGGAVVSIFGGPSLGFNLSSEIKLEADGESLTVDVKDDTESLDFGLEIGAGLEFPLGTMTAFVRPSYYLGFMEYADGGDSHHRNFKLKAGVHFPIAPRSGDSVAP